MPAKHLKLWIGVFLSAAMLYIAARGLQWRQVSEALSTARYVWLAPALAVYFSGMLLRAWRWRILLRPLTRPGVGVIFGLLLLGYMGNNVFPARAGEFMRAYALRRREGVPVSATLATIVLERVFDALVMIVFLFSTVTLVTTFGNRTGMAAAIGAVCVMALAAFVLIAAKPAFLTRLYHIACETLLSDKLRERVRGVVKRFVAGLQSLQSPGAIAAALGLSLGAWLCEASTYFLISQAFSDLHVSFVQMMLMVAVTNFATTLPSTPGYVGTFDAPGIALLQTFGVAHALAAGFTLVLHVVLWLPITLAGWVAAVVLTRSFPDAAFSEEDDSEEASSGELLEVSS
ncbi:MAG: flippase-like domain-containing protein [Armatimonadetes bacterium]|nr:flippase-like domain-containing protein [Armatimonadota bacterium]